MNASCRHLRLCERRRLTEMPAFPSRGLVWWVTQPCKQGVASQRNQSSLSSVRDQGLSAFFDAFPHTQHSTHSGEGGREGSTKGQSGQKPKEVIDSVSYFPLQLWRDAWQLGLGGVRGRSTWTSQSDSPKIESGFATHSFKAPSEWLHLLGPQFPYL